MRQPATLKIAIPAIIIIICWSEVKAMRYDENLNISGVTFFSGRFHIISYSCTLVI